MWTEYHWCFLTATIQEDGAYSIPILSAAAKTQHLTMTEFMARIHNSSKQYHDCNYSLPKPLGAMLSLFVHQRHLAPTCYLLVMQLSFPRLLSEPHPG